MENQDKTADNIKTNKSNFVLFEKRNSGYAGDRGTWARIEGDKMIVCRAQKGIISNDYEHEMTAFLDMFGVDFSDIKPGKKLEVSLNVIKPAQPVQLKKIQTNNDFIDFEILDANFNNYISYDVIDIDSFYEGYAKCLKEIMSLGRKGEDDYHITIIFEKDGKFAGSVDRNDFRYTCENLVSNEYYILDEHDRGRILDDICGDDYRITSILESH